MSPLQSSRAGTTSRRHGGCRLGPDTLSVRAEEPWDGSKEASGEGGGRESTLFATSEECCSQTQTRTFRWFGCSVGERYVFFESVTVRINNLSARGVENGSSRLNAEGLAPKVNMK